MLAWLRRVFGKPVVRPGDTPQPRRRYRVRYTLKGRVLVFATDSGTEARKTCEAFQRRTDIAWGEFWDGDVMRSDWERA